MPLFKLDLQSYELFFQKMKALFRKKVKSVYDLLRADYSPGNKNPKKKAYQIKKNFDLEFDESASDLGKNKTNIVVGKMFESEEEKFKSEREKNQDYKIKELQLVIEKLNVRLESMEKEVAQLKSQQ